MNGRRIEVTVSLWIDEDADVAEVFENMDYEFSYEDKILETEIIDLNTEV
jgi:hypothetical protein